LLELQSYKRKHGHVNVKQSDGKLGRFVDNIRRVYKCFLEGKDTNGKILESERVELYQQQFERLEAIGFEWVAKDNRLIWDKRVQELVAFKERHKHCQVAMRDGSLGRWVDNIRHRYRDMNRHEMSRVMREKLEDLDRLGFVWHVK
jgi:Helicase associated domain